MQQKTDILTGFLPQAHQSLLADMDRYVSLNDSQRLEITSRLSVQHFKKKAVIVQRGTVCQEIFFVHTGIICLYANDDKGTDHALQFGVSGWWLTDISSFLSRQLSEYRIESAESCTLACLSRNDYDFLLATIPAIGDYFRIVMEKKYATAIKKIELLMCEPAEERFEKFNRAFPRFVQKVPQYVLAPVLGFTPQFLSMLRARLRRESAPMPGTEQNNLNGRY